MESELGEHGQETFGRKSRFVDLKDWKVCRSSHNAVKEMILFILVSLLKCQLFLQKSLPFQWNSNIRLIILIEMWTRLGSMNFQANPSIQFLIFPLPKRKTPLFFFLFPSIFILPLPELSIPLHLFLFSTVS